MKHISYSGDEEELELAVALAADERCAMGIGSEVGRDWGWGRSGMLLVRSVRAGAMRGEASEDDACRFARIDGEACKT